MTEQRRRELCTELAQAMGKHFWFTDTNPNHDGTRWLSTRKAMATTCRQYSTVNETSDNSLLIDWELSDLPDPFTNAADNRALVAWICVNDYKSAFGDELLKALGIRDKFLGDIFPAEFHIADILNAPLEAITLAAARALGIETE